ncbi:HD superfamily phosphodieaserase [Fructobacillus cardui]|uniref:GNAT family N-acetyltransferase n=1 Tax=Fructobacillus cardui TaxID=2893170 RepID=UPI002D84BC8C|nr:HD superfamily phosphodieaserase [Fructobacillus cardui]
MAIDLTAIRNFARETFKGDTSGHDFLHAKQVARLAVSLYEEDHGQVSEQDQAILEAAALLHDTIGDKVVADVAAQQILVEDLLCQSGITPIGQALVAETITHLSYSANLKKHYDLPLLGQYVQDADRLEVLGAIGIARTFAYGGQKGHPLYDPAIKPVQLQTKDQYRHHQTTSVNHFYEKLLKLADQLNTPAGQEEGQRRSAFMENFLAEFQRETEALSDPAFRVQQGGNEPMAKMKEVTAADIAALQDISRRTFAETFADDNSAADLNEYLDTAYATDKLLAEVENPNSQFYFVFHDDELAGYLKVNWGSAQSEEEGDASLEVERIYLLAAFQRLGLGRQLLNQAFDQANALGKSRVWLGVWEHNQNALAFYQKIGFTPFSDHVFQLGTDAQRDILMEKVLN